MATRKALVAALVVVSLGGLSYSIGATGLKQKLYEALGYNPNPVTLQRPTPEPLSALATLGQHIYFDKSLSASGTQSCASCHSPGNAYGPPNDLRVQLGGAKMADEGYRAPPSLKYLYRQAPFSIGPDAGETDVPVDLNVLASTAGDAPRAAKQAGGTAAAQNLVPQGGLFWDGRADTLQIQAIGPLLNPVEMANHSEAEVAAKLTSAPYASQFEALFGKGILNKPALLIQEAMSALSRYQVEDSSFHPYSSKYDYWLEGKTRMTSAELRGMQLFNDPTKANCAGCHVSKPSGDGLPPLFTDTQYESLGVPRNTKLAINKDPHFFDMGVCGPFRQDLANQTQYCGMFLTPTLRNTALRKTFFHNGVYSSLEEVMNFYNLRDTNPELIYGDGKSKQWVKYNDLPEKYDANVDNTDLPFGQKLGGTPMMTQEDIKDIIAFLNTLNDGYKLTN